MDYFNEQFLEAYKKVDKICQEIYCSNIGITNYINDMKNTPTYNSRQIANWHSDLNSLIKYRHIRNQLTHEVGTLEYSMCDSCDIECLEGFYNRLLAAEDPLALLNQHKQKTQSPPKASTEYNASYYTPSVSNNNNSGCSYGLFAFLISILCFGIIAALIYLLK